VAKSYSRPNMRNRMGLPASKAIWMAISAVIALAVWQGSVSLFHLPSYVLPQPLAVWHSLVAGLVANPTAKTSYWYQLADTMEATFAGFVIAAFLGLALAAIMSEWRVAHRILFSYVVWFQSLPKVAIAPLFVIWFGYRMESKIAMSATVTLFPILLNALEGFGTVERERIDLMRSLHAGRWQIFWMIKLPSAMPFIFAGLNLGIVYALLGVIISEFLGAQRGIGVIITQLDAVSDTAGVFSILIVLAIASHVLISMMRGLQKRFVFWSVAEHDKVESV
jgi:NitT/TauT family transport system permease protein